MTVSWNCFCRGTNERRVDVLSTGQVSSTSGSVAAAKITCGAYIRDVVRLAILVCACVFLVGPSSAQAQRVRKNQALLTATERSAFVNALNMMFNGGQLLANADHHTMHSSSVHSSSLGYRELFLPWHRKMMYEFETDLLAADMILNNGVQVLQGLPYWDFVTDKTWGTLGTSPFQTGFLGVGGINATPPFSSWLVTCPPSAVAAGGVDCLRSPPGTGPTSTEVLRRASSWASGTSGTIPGLPTQIAQDSVFALGPTKFHNSGGFSQTVEQSLHNSVHTSVGGLVTVGGQVVAQGHLASVSQAPFDPAFYMLHANVDRIWASWQTVYGEANTFQSTAAMPGYPGMTPQSVLSISNMNYEYDAFIHTAPPECIDDFTPDLSPSHVVNETATFNNPADDFEPIAPLVDTPINPGTGAAVMGRTISLIELTSAGGEAVSAASNPPAGILNVASSANADGGAQLSYYSNYYDTTTAFKQGGRLRHDVSGRSPSEGIIVYFDTPLSSSVELDVVLRSYDPTITGAEPFDVYEQARLIPAGPAVFFPFQLFVDKTGNVPFVASGGQLPYLIDGIDFNFKVNNGDDFGIDRICIGAPEPGFTQFAPLIPDTFLVKDPVFRYRDVASGRWYDPPLAFGYDYRTESDSLFTDIALPEGYGGANVFVLPLDGGEIALGSFGEGSRLRFADFAALLGGALEFDFIRSVAGVRAFRLTGLQVDALDPLGFPLYVNANTETMSFSQTPLAIPEPNSILAASIGLLILCVAHHSRNPRPF